MGEMMNEKLNAAITDLVLGKLPPGEASRLLDAISGDARLSSVLEQTIELESFSQGSGKAIYEDRVAPRNSPRRPTNVSSRTALADVVWRRRVVPITLLLPVVIMCLVTRSAITVRDTLNEPATAWISWASQRSSANTDLVYAEMLVKAGEYENAHRVLTRHIRSHPKDVLRGQVQYNAAVLALFHARKEVLGIWVLNDSLEVRAGVEILDSVMLGHNPIAVRNRACFLRAKALVAIGDDQEALVELLRLASIDQEYKGSAEALMAKVRGK
jgi:hypothetical protein